MRSMPSAENLEKIAKVFNITVEELLINSAFDDEASLRQKICEKAQKLEGEQLKALYLIASDL